MPALATLVLGVAMATPATGAAGPRGTAAHVRARGTGRFDARTARIAVDLTIDPGFHIYANPASLPELIPTALRFPEFPGVRPRYPAGTTLSTSFAHIPLAVYQGRVQLLADLPAAALTGRSTIRAIVQVQACTMHLCLPPSDLTLRIAVPLR